MSLFDHVGDAVGRQRQQTSQLGFMFKLRLVLKAIIAGQSAHQLAAFPIIEDAAHILARYARHGGDIALPDLLSDDNAARADILAEILSEFEQGRSDAAFAAAGNSRRRSQYRSRADARREA